MNEKQSALLQQLQAEVLQANTYMNLTAITDPTDFAVKHIIDSMTVLPYIPQGAAVLDLGTGAGFPGLVIAVLRDDVKLTLMDSTRKKINFVAETAKKLGLTVECVHARAEEAKKTHGSKYDICTARAVASLDKLITWGLPLLKPGGRLLAMKSTSNESTLPEAVTALTKQNGKITNIQSCTIAEDTQRCIIEVTRLK